MTAFNRTDWIGFLLVLAFALTSPAHGQVFRCKDATGKLSFSDRPCDSGQSGALVQRQPQRPPKVLHLWPPKLLHPGHVDLTH